METPLSIMGNFLAKEAQEKVRDKDGPQNLRDKNDPGGKLSEWCKHFWTCSGMHNGVVS